jgi:hypothetical protein
MRTTEVMSPSKIATPKILMEYSFEIVQVRSVVLSYPSFERSNRSFHTCVQDVQITRMTNNKVNNSQCNDYNIIRVYLL